jgi:hypothetical protein
MARVGGTTKNTNRTKKDLVVLVLSAAVLVLSAAVLGSVSQLPDGGITRTTAFSSGKAKATSLTFSNCSTVNFLGSTF